MVIENRPLPSAVSVAITVLPPINKLTVLPASAVPAIVGVASSLSKSEAVVVIVVCCIVASIVIDKASDASEIFPAASSAVTVKA